MTYNKILKKLIDSLNANKNHFKDSIKKIIDACYGVIGVAKEYTEAKKTEITNDNARKLKIKELNEIIEQRMPDLNKEGKEFVIDLFT